MRTITLRVRTEDVDEAYDRLLPLLPAGLHERREGEQTALVALGENGELPAPATLAQAAGDLLCGEVVEQDAGTDLARALAALAPHWEIGDRVVLRTPAHPAPPEHMIDVVLMRALGFGTGAHPTTRHCIELLLTVDAEGAFADLGCGASALTIAAAKLGFAPIVGVDLVDDALETAHANAELNGIDADFVTANLLVLQQLDVRVAAANVSELEVHEHITTIAAPQLEVLIVSGLDHPGRLAHALAGYAGMGFAEERRIERSGWPAVLLRRAL